MMSKEQRVQCAKEYFNQGYNCCQSVVLAFKDICEVDEKSLMKLSVGLGGGVGRMREVCGCVCGMAVLSGFISQGEPKSDEAQSQLIHQQKTAAYTLVQKMTAEFKKETGSIICRELLGLKAANQAQTSGGNAVDADFTHGNMNQVSPVPEQRSAEYYRKRPCVEMVALAARIVAESLAEE